MSSVESRYVSRLKQRLRTYAQSGQPEPDYLARVEPDPFYGPDGVPSNCNGCPARLSGTARCEVFGARLRPSCPIGRLFLARATNPDAPQPEYDEP
jgi:hypothetical protein